ADVVAPEGLAHAREEIAALNPLSEIVAMADRERAVAAAFAPLAGIAPMPAPPLAGEPSATSPLFLVIIARDLRAAELEAVAPAGLFAFSSWAEPAALS